jgi:hypothetical protein
MGDAGEGSDENRSCGARMTPPFKGALLAIGIGTAGVFFLASGIQGNTKLELAGQRCVVAAQGLSLSPGVDRALRRADRPRALDLSTPSLVDPAWAQIQTETVPVCAGSR